MQTGIWGSQLDQRALCSLYNAEVTIYCLRNKTVDTYRYSERPTRFVTVLFDSAHYDSLRVVQTSEYETARPAKPLVQNDSGINNPDA